MDIIRVELRDSISSMPRLLINQNVLVVCEPKQFWYNEKQSPCNNNIARAITTGVNLLLHGLARVITKLSALLLHSTEQQSRNNWNLHGREQHAIGKIVLPQQGDLKVDFGRPPMLLSRAGFREKTGHDVITAQITWNNRHEVITTVIASPSS